MVLTLWEIDGDKDADCERLTLSDWDSDPLKLPDSVMMLEIVVEKVMDGVGVGGGVMVLDKLPDAEAETEILIDTDQPGFLKRKACWACGTVTGTEPVWTS